MELVLDVRTHALAFAMTNDQVDGFRYFRGYYRRDTTPQFEAPLAFTGQCHMDELVSGYPGRLVVTDTNEDGYPDLDIEFVEFACSRCSHGPDHGLPVGDECEPVVDGYLGGRSSWLYDPAADAWLNPH